MIYIHTYIHIPFKLTCRPVGIDDVSAGGADNVCWGWWGGRHICDHSLSRSGLCLHSVSPGHHGHGVHQQQQQEEKQSFGVRFSTTLHHELIIAARIHYQPGSTLYYEMDGPDRLIHSGFLVFSARTTFVDSTIEGVSVHQLGHTFYTYNGGILWCQAALDNVTMWDPHAQLDLISIQGCWFLVRFQLKWWHIDHDNQNLASDDCKF